MSQRHALALWAGLVGMVTAAGIDIEPPPPAKGRR
jgi:hypothetical protein